jgi:hypothetical protein
VDVNGVVWAWGNNTSGQLGVDPLVSVASKYPVALDSDLFGGGRVMSVAAGQAHSLAVTETGDVYAWGAHDAGQLGDGSAVTAAAGYVPVRVINGTATGAVASGNRSAYLNGVYLQSQPVTTQVAAGTATLTSVARLSGDAFGVWSRPQSAGGRISYEWYKGALGAEVLDASNTTSTATFAVTAGMAHLSVYLKVTAIETDSIAYSNVVGVWELGSIGDTAVVGRPLGSVIASGGVTSLSVTTNATAPVFSWTRNGNFVSPASVYSGARLVGSQLVSAGEGVYSVTVSGGNVAVPETITVGVRSWASLAGTYQALLQNTTSPAADSSTDMRYPGRVTVILTSTGSFSGRLEYEGDTYSLAGTFDGTTLNSVVAIGRGSAASSVNLELKFSQSDLVNLTMTATTSEVLRANATTPWLGTSVASPTTLSATATLSKSPLTAAGVNASGQTNPQFAALLKDTTTSGGTLRATGYMSLRVTSGGVVTTVARTGDGTVAGDGVDVSMVTTSSGYVGATGIVPVYTGVYGTAYPTRGYVAGALKLDWTAANAVDMTGAGGELEWKKPGTVVTGLSRKLTPIGSRYDASVSAVTVLGTLSGLRLSAYEPGEVLLGAGTVKFGMTNVGITSTWTINTAVARTVVNPGVANLTQLTMSTVAGTPLVTANLYDANGARTFQSVGVILQTPLGAGSGGVAPGVYGLIPFIRSGTTSIIYTEWSLR